MTPLAQLVAALTELDGVTVRRDEPMARHTPLRIGGPADAWAVVDTPEALRQTVKAARAHKVRWTVHWPFEDVIVQDGRMQGLVIRPGPGFERVEQTAPERVVLGAAAPFASLSRLGPSWWSTLVRWPGTPGALLHGGRGDQLSGMVVGVRWLRGRGVVEAEVAQGEAPPAPPTNATLVDITLAPGLLVSAGDGHLGPYPPGWVFADPETRKGPRRTAADELVDARLEGTRLKAWRLSAERPGIAVNLGGGTAADLVLLAKGTSARTQALLGRKLDLRLPVVGEPAGRKTRGGRR